MHPSAAPFARFSPGAPAPAAGTVAKDRRWHAEMHAESVALRHPEHSSRAQAREAV
jgi:hypothetical protein